MFIGACAPKIYLPKQNLNEIEGEHQNKEKDDIAPAMEKISECLVVDDINLNDSLRVMPSSEFIRKLFNYDDEFADKEQRKVIDNMTKSVESLYFTDFKSGFASFSHPPVAEYLMGQNLPFDKDENAGGTDIFYFAPDKNNQIKFRSFNKINSPYWDSHPIAITQKNSHNICVTLLIFSSDRNSPFSKAINAKGDTIYGGSTDLFYSFGVYDSLNRFNNNENNFLNLKWTEPRQIFGVNTPDKNEGSPFIYCQCCNPTLFFTSNRNNINNFDYDIYATKLDIDYDNLSLSAIENPEMIDEKSMTTDSLTFSINTIADERFPYIPFPHNENAKDNPIYFSSDRNKKNINRECNCERGNDRTENIGGYDIYKYDLPERFNCPKETKQPELPVFQPDLMAEIVVINLENPDEQVKEAFIAIRNEDGELIKEVSNQDRLKISLDFDKKYSISGGSSFNSLDCSLNQDIIFRGYKKPKESFYEIGRDSSITLELINGFTLEAREFLNINQDLTRNEKGFIFEKGIRLNSDDEINEKVINARIIGDMVYYDKQITVKKFWNRINIRPMPESDDFTGESALKGTVRSIGTMNEKMYFNKPKSNDKFVLYDTIFLLPDYIYKPPCYCEFAGVLTSYQQNVPYYQTGFWEVNTLLNYRRDLGRLESGKFSEARWVELHKDNQYFGEGKKGRLVRKNEYEDYARVVDSNLIKMAQMVSEKIIPTFRVIDSITPGSKLIISLDAWSDKRPVKRGWYIGDEINYIEGSLQEKANEYDINMSKVLIKDKSSLNLNNDTLSRLRAYYGYKAFLEKLLDTSKVGSGFYEYYKKGLVLLPDDEELLKINLNKPYSLKSIEEQVYNSKIIILAKGNYFDPTEYKIPQYIRDVDSSLFMLDTIRRIDVRINTLQYQAGKLIKSPCCNELLPCVDFNKLFRIGNKTVNVNATERRRIRK